VVLTRVNEDIYPPYTAKIPVHLVILEQVNTASVSAAMTKMVLKLRLLFFCLSCRSSRKL